MPILKANCTPVLVATLVAVTFMTACTPKEIDRTERRPHTAMRGVAYKRLILTLNEANALAYRAGDYAEMMNASEDVDPDTKARATELVTESEKFADDIEWSLANNQRMTWHRTEMNRLWKEFQSLYPEDAEYSKGYTTWSMRKPTPKLRLKFNYDDNYGIEKQEPQWEDLQPVIRKFYETE